MTSVPSWPQLQTAALDDTHPSWFPGIDENLLERARASPLGRRWLASRLAEEGAPILFSNPRPPDSAAAAALAEHGWLLPRLGAAAELCFELGVYGLAPALRASISREVVARVRRVVGDARYQQVLRMPSRTAPSTVNAATSLKLPDDDLALRERLMAQGVTELVALAASSHAALAERVRVAFGREIARLNLKAWLPIADALACVASVPATQRTVTGGSHG